MHKWCWVGGMTIFLGREHHRVVLALCATAVACFTNRAAALTAEVIGSAAAPSIVADERHLSGTNAGTNVGSTLGFGIGLFECYWHCSVVEFVPQCNYDNGVTHRNQCEMERDVLCKTAPMYVPSTITTATTTVSSSNSDEYTASSTATSGKTHSDLLNTQSTNHNSNDGSSRSSSSSSSSISSSSSSIKVYKFYRALGDNLKYNVLNVLRTNVPLLGSNLRHYFRGAARHNAIPQSTLTGDSSNSSAAVTTAAASSSNSTSGSIWGLPCDGFASQHSDDILRYLATPRPAAVHGPPTVPLTTLLHTAAHSPLTLAVTPTEATQFSSSSAGGTPSTDNVFWWANFILKSSDSRRVVVPVPETVLLPQLQLDKEGLHSGGPHSSPPATPCAAQTSADLLQQQRSSSTSDPSAVFVSVDVVTYVQSALLSQFTINKLLPGVTGAAANTCVGFFVRTDTEYTGRGTTDTGSGRTVGTSSKRLPLSCGEALFGVAIGTGTESVGGYRVCGGRYVMWGAGLERIHYLVGGAQRTAIAALVQATGTGTGVGDGGGDAVTNDSPSSSSSTAHGGGGIGVCWVDMALPTVYHHVGQLQLHPLTVLSRTVTRRVPQEVRVRMFLNPGWNLSSTIEVDERYSGMTRLSLKAGDCKGLYYEDSLGSSRGISSVRRYSRSAAHHRSAGRSGVGARNSSSYSKSGSSSGGGGTSEVPEEDKEDGPLGGTAVQPIVTELTFDIKADFRETPNTFADWRRRQLSRNRRGPAARPLPPYYSSPVLLAVQRRLPCAAPLTSLIRSTPLVTAAVALLKLFEDHADQRPHSDYSSNAAAPRHGEGIPVWEHGHANVTLEDEPATVFRELSTSRRRVYSSTNRMDSDLMSFNLCLYSSDNEVLGASIGRVRFLPDQRDAAELVALMMFYAMAIPLLCGATLSCYMYRSQQRRKTLRRVRLVQQYDHIEQRLLIEMGGFGNVGGRGAAMSSAHRVAVESTHTTLSTNGAVTC